MTALPEGFGALKKLRRLDLSGNEKPADISALTELPDLENLDLSGCPITSLGSSFATLKGLVSVIISNKALKNLEGLRDLPALEKLHLHTEIEALPPELNQLRSLTVYAEDSEVDLPSYRELQKLAVNASFFALPVLPKLQSLRIGKAKERIDLRTTGQSPELRALTIHRSETLTELPEELTLARSLP